MCRRYFRHDHEAIESVNDGMLKVFGLIRTYRKEKGKFFNWVYTIVRNTALDKYRAQQTLLNAPSTFNGLGNIPEIANGHNPLESIEEKDLRLLLDNLSPATRVVCTLHYLEGYLIRDIAAELVISEGTVKWHLSEGRKKLRNVLEKKLKYGP
jgi:RNA polymerase sigma-70 factor (ECF subfamily)